MPTWTDDDIQRNAQVFRDKLRAFKQRQSVLHAVEQGRMDFVLLDVRPRASFDEAHIPGAWCAPRDELAAVMPLLPRDRELVTYCWSFD